VRPEDDNVVSVYQVHKPVLVVDRPRPAARKHVTKQLGLSTLDAFVGHYRPIG
jgi:hypothetical protein